uniref:tRNA(Ile)-lysidine synthase, chloroplastic n=1 Tax=Hazenia capsulata TaxID=2202518 RepID=A0A1W6EHJ8_9CHLO|nr:tRNA(Ile)-lysidine synthetase [Hazenia capsulata]ARK14892.1 tRNA(Ile)-lysidine synthetase [Hazenia capsulata]
MSMNLDCLKLLNFIETSTFFKTNHIRHKKILIAFSGGQDSLCLLTVFFILCQKWEFQLGVVYCNHCWKDSNETSLAVFKILEKFDIPFYFVESPNSKPMKPEQKARIWRYSSFHTILKWEKYDFVLTGHTLSDCAETVLFNLFRGTGLKGICSLKEYQTFEMSKDNPFFFKKTKFESLSNVSSTFLKKKVNETLFLNSSFLSFISKTPFFWFSTNLREVRLKKDFNSFSSLVSSYLETHVKDLYFSSAIFILYRRCKRKKNLFSHTSYEAFYFKSKLKIDGRRSRSLLASVPTRWTYSNSVSCFSFSQLMKFFAIAKKFSMQTSSFSSFGKNRRFQSCRGTCFFALAKTFFRTGKRRGLCRYFIGSALQNSNLLLFTLLTLPYKARPSTFFLSPLPFAFGKRQKISLEHSIFTKGKKLRGLASTVQDRNGKMKIKTPGKPFVLWVLPCKVKNENSSQKRKSFNFAATVQGNFFFAIAKKIFMEPQLFPVGKKPGWNLRFLQKNWLFPCRLRYKVSKFFTNKKLQVRNLNLRYKLPTKLKKAKVKKTFFLSKIQTHFLKQKLIFSDVAKQKALNGGPCFIKQSQESEKNETNLFDVYIKNVKNYQKVDKFSSFITIFKPRFKSSQPYFLNAKIERLIKKKTVKEPNFFNKKKRLINQKQNEKIIGKVNSITELKTNQIELKQTNEEFLVFRPFLKINRHTLFLFSKQLTLPVHYDKSNKDLNISRNFIRKVILPLLKKINPRVEENLYKFSRIIEFYYEFIGDLKCPPNRFEIFNP